MIMKNKLISLLLQYLLKTKHVKQFCSTLCTPAHNSIYKSRFHCIDPFAFKLNVRQYWNVDLNDWLQYNIIRIFIYFQLEMLQIAVAYETGEDVQEGHLSPFAKYMLENSCISIYRWSTFVFLSNEWVLRGEKGNSSVCFDQLLLSFCRIYFIVSWNKKPR